MVKPISTKFSVRPEHEAAAIAYLQERGFPPSAVETDEKGLKVLVFSPRPDDQMFGLAQALPVHLSAKIGIVVGDNLPFGPAGSNDG